MNKKKRKQYLLAAVVVLLAIIGFNYYYFFCSFTSKDETSYIYIDDDDNIDSVLAKLKPVATTHGLHGFCTLSRHFGYDKHIRPGRYEVSPGVGAMRLFRNLRNGMQAPVALTIPSVRTMERLSAEVAKKLMMDSTALVKLLKDQDVCRKYGYDTATIACMFIPETYDVYWNITPLHFLDRMQKECRKFWNESRMAKAKQMGLTPVEVSTLASIVDEETSNDGEKPMVAGMYINRLKFRDSEYPEGMPLQADPTIKFAWKRFDLKRIYHNLLSINSPYNTYKNTGLPPGPIRIPSVAGIDAVLNYVHHDYLYMCAKEDFSGTHNFAHTYKEHLDNAARYAKALNERGIK